MMDANFIPSVALVTGGAVRVGKVIALSLARAGYDIALHYCSSQEEAKKTASLIEKEGRKVTLHKYDLADVSQCSALIDDVMSQHGALDVLVNNSSVIHEISFLDTPEEVFDLQMNLNYKAPFFLTQYFAKNRKSDKVGNVVNILDTYINRSAQPYFSYLLSKKVLAELTKMSARALGPVIRVNGVAPGIVLPSPGGRGEEYMAARGKKLPLASVANTDYVANAVLQLIDNPAVTGQILYIDGGEHLI